MTRATQVDPLSEEKLRRRIAAGSQNSQDYCELADLVVAAGNYEEAISLYGRALNLPLTNLQKARVSTELGWLFYEIGQQAKALPLAQSAIGLSSQETEGTEVLICRGASQSLLAHCLWSEDENSARNAAGLALTWLEQVIVDTPNLEGIAAVYYDAARLHNLLGNSKKAISMCEKSLKKELDQRSRLACLVVLAEALRLEGQLTEAEETLKEALKSAETDKGTLPLVCFTLGLVQRALNRPAEARETFQKALVALQAHPYLHEELSFLSEIYMNLAAVYNNLGEYKQAAAGYQEVLRCHPEYDHYRHDALISLGRCYLASGDYAKARHYFEEGVNSPRATESEKASAREGLGELYYESEDYEKAAEMFQQALIYEKEADPDHWNTLLWLGHAYEGKGDHEKARKCYEGILTSPHASETDKASAREGLDRLSSSQKRTLH